MKAIVTGGCGFIGSHLVRALIQRNISVLNIDKLTYAGRLENLEDIKSCKYYYFVQEDIVNQPKIASLCNDFDPDIIFHLAAESHVDRSIDDPFAFIHTNIEGTYSLLISALHLMEKGKKLKKFIQVSTDEVYGALGKDEFFNESTPYHPNSPYAASKASSDLLAKSFYYTYQLPVIVTNCSNNYGPNQFPEKLIPLVILNALAKQPLPIYGKGNQIRDWIYVLDHTRTLIDIAEKGTIGSSYCIGSQCEKTNLDVVKLICKKLDVIYPIKNKKYSDLIQFVQDRPGHDVRYAIDNQKIKSEFNFKPILSFDEGIEQTLEWYIRNQAWVKAINTQQATQRRGLKKVV